MDWCILGSFTVYLVLMLAIGFAFSGQQEDLGDYYLGGRRMNKWVVALSAQASDMSGWLLMGLPGAIFVAGLSEAWIGIGLGIGTYLNWKIVARRLRTYSRVCGDAITVPDFVLSFAVSVVVSLATKPPSAEILAEFEKAGSGEPFRAISAGRDTE